MSPRYKSPMSTGYRKPITVYDTDPRAKRKRELEKYRASIGSEVIVEKAPLDNIYLEEYVKPEDYWISKFQPERGDGQVLAYDNGVKVVFGGGPSISSYDLSGKIKWSKTMVRPSTDNDINGAGRFNAIDSAGNTYHVWRRRYGPATSPTVVIPNVVIIKINSNGQKVWEKTIQLPYYPGSSSEGVYWDFRISSLAIDKNNNLCVMCYIYDYLNVAAMIIRFDKNNGDELLRKYFKDPTGPHQQAPGSNSDLEIINMTFDSNNNLIFLSKLRGSWLIVKCDSNFNQLDSFRITTYYTTEYSGVGVIRKILVDSQSNYILLMSAYTSDFGPFEDIQKISIVKINANKTIAWSKTFYDHSLFQSVFRITNFDIDNNDNIYIGRKNYFTFAGNGGTTPLSASIAKFLSNGDLSWVNKINIPSNNQSTITGSIQVKNSSLFFTGAVLSYFGGTSPRYTFLGKLPINGAYTSTQSFFTTPASPPIATSYQVDSLSFIPNLNVNIIPNNIELLTPPPYPYNFYTTNDIQVIDGLQLNPFSASDSGGINETHYLS